jgi:hypothetical protein
MVYHRLQELQIPCRVSVDRALQVQLDTPQAAIQLWSVVRQLTAPRQELAYWLEGCWHLKTHRQES